MSARQFSGPSGMGAGVAPAQSTLWSYAVPAQKEPLEYSNGHSASGEASSSSFSSRPRQPLSTHTNGSLRPKTRSKSKSMQGLDTAFISSGPLRPSFNSQGDVSGATSDADSLLDFYKPSKESLRAASREPPMVKRKASLGAVSSLSAVTQEDPDKWIHRDKLQQIEIREMMEQGRRIDFPSRSASRAGATSRAATEADVHSQDDRDELVYPETKRLKAFAPTLSSDELHEEQQSMVERAHGNSDVATTPTQASHNRRPSTSRIPVTKNSPTEDAPVALMNGRTRARSGSQSSQNMLDNPKKTTKVFNPANENGSSPQTSPNGSPPKTRAASKTTAARGGRTPARGGSRAASNQSRPRTATSPANDSISRPGTSSGRPPIVRPEGDPPWIDTMYKPDPRLPPDQQMLPTHAKRLAEKRMGFDPYGPRKHPDLILLDDEDSQNEGSGSAKEEQTSQAQPSGLQHAQDGSPERTRTHLDSPRERDSQQSQKRNSWRSDGRSSPNVQRENQNNDQWPLRTLSFNKYAAEKPTHDSAANSESDSAGNMRPGLHSSESGSYSLMPAIQTPQEMEQRLSNRSRLSSPINESATASLPQVTRLPEEPQSDPAEKEKEKKKGCMGLGCCVVM